jgi:tetratricopeptide (TPR) repeat protein
MENLELFERIERFINNEMSAEEKEQFENDLKSNPELSKAYEDQREIQMVVELGALSESLDEIHNEVVGSQKSSKNNWWAIAAGIAIIIAAGVYLFQQGSPQDQLFATYSTTDPGLPVPMSSVDHYVFYDAMVDYKAEKYEVAIKKWKGLVRAEPENDTLNYYVGSAYYNLESYSEAVKFFDKIDPESESELRYKSQWYRILSWIKLNEKEKILAQNPYAGSPYSEKIVEIQKALEK